MIIKAAADQKSPRRNNAIFTVSPRFFIYKDSEKRKTGGEKCLISLAVISVGSCPFAPSRAAQLKIAASFTFIEDIEALFYKLLGFLAHGD